MLFSSMNINTSLIIFFLTGPEGGGGGARVFAYKVCYCQSSFSSCDCETNFLWTDSKDDLVSDVFF